MGQSPCFKELYTEPVQLIVHREMVAQVKCGSRIILYTWKAFPTLASADPKFASGGQGLGPYDPYVASGGQGFPPWTRAALGWPLRVTTPHAPEATRPRLPGPGRSSGGALHLDRADAARLGGACATGCHSR
ncbi:hypothetical protein GCM10009828_063370 [Actinoplanes couchii]|uniref:Uncharacterized protein n=1 Tax=Actinoplanes couchii TaxID=403638 RepID=A0ABQ3X3D0_9ACTN|nr:hypothetical protein Aco03nite_014420 [Actinoplanes couchii]